MNGPGYRPDKRPKGPSDKPGAPSNGSSDHRRPRLNAA